MAMDKAKLRALNKLSDKGFNTTAKISSIDMVTIRDEGLVNDISFIIEIQEAIKGDVLAFLLNGSDSKEMEDEDGRE